jgi:solute carrier family 25 (mitochondrial citrate transporter), member 1
MQSIEARKEYKNSFHCAAQIFKKEGLLTFWSGAVPRLARLIMSGGIVFTMYVNSKTNFLIHINIARYEKSMDLMDKIDPDKKYI